jgi:DNA-directed RNA polymerase specialized sigma24 family protein
MISAEIFSPQDAVAGLVPGVLPLLSGVSPEDCDPSIDEMIARYEPFIRMQVKRKALTYHILVHPETLDLELDDIAERVLVSFWQKLQAGAIHYPEAYIQRMIDYAFLDILRRQKRQGMPLSLSTHREDDPSRASVPEVCDDTTPDPEADILQQEAAWELAAQLARAIEQLPPRQKRAMECSLCESLAELRQFSATFAICHVNIENARWPGTDEEKRRLKASLFAARSALARALHIDISEYKRRGASRTL